MAERTGKYVDGDKAFFLHPNVQKAYLNYKGDAQAFQKEMREGKNGHNDDYDEIMKQVAEERTDTYIANGGRFPKRR